MDVEDDTGRLVLLGPDPEATAQRFAIWSAGASAASLLVFVLSAGSAYLLSSVLVFFVGVLGFGFLYVALRLLRHRIPHLVMPLLGPSFTSAWWRIRVGPDGLSLDRLYGEGRPPQARVLADTPATASLQVPFERARLSWAELGPVTHIEAGLVVDGRTYPLHDPGEARHLAERLESMRRRFVDGGAEV